MKSLRIPSLAAAFAGIASIASMHATAAPYASFSDMETDWQRLSSPGTAWQNPQHNLSRAPADPIERPRPLAIAQRAFNRKRTRGKRNRAPIIRPINRPRGRRSREDPCVLRQLHSAAGTSPTPSVPINSSRRRNCFSIDDHLTTD